ncbi:MAG: hypothetical protein U0L55_03350 [Acutalibacteraceae bacterium]|nr:hypothetical protein [Acutalibacteraceae bacterium]
MEYLISFIKILSVTSVIIAAIWLIMPKGATGEFLKYAMSLFVIAVILSAVGSFELKFDTDYTPAEKSQTLPTQVAKDLSNESAKYIIEKLLYDCQIKFKEVRIITDNSDSSNINITKAEIYLKNDSDFLRAAEIIKNQTGITAVEG